MRVIKLRIKSAAKLNKSFTLVELLIVVAIIGILASLLLPVLGKARKKAQSVVCKNQLKQISLSMIMFTDDNDGFLPHVRLDDPVARSKTWTWSVAPYLGLDRQENGAMRTVDVNLDQHVLKCSSNETIINYGTDVYITGYAMPVWAGYGLATKLVDGKTVSDSRYNPVKLIYVSAPSDALLLGESTGYYFNGGQSSFETGIYHSGKWNRLFVDGSVNQGFQDRGFATMDIAYYWNRWSFDTGY